MKKNSAFGIWAAIGIAIGYAAILWLIITKGKTVPEGIELPAGFPTAAGMTVIWGILFLLWAAGGFFVYSVRISPRRMRNIFLNSLILVIGIFVWNYLILSKVNFSGALAVAIAILILALVVWFMFLVTHRYGGYLFIPMMIWMCFVLYLSISLVVKNSP